MERLLNLSPAFGKARAIQEAVLVQHPEDFFQSLLEEQLSVAAHIHRLDVQDRVLAVKEGNNVKKREREQEHRLGEAGGITKPDHLPAVGLQGKALKRAESRPVR